MIGPNRLFRGIKWRIIQRWNRAHERALVLRHSRDLVWLGKHYKTDKWGEHWYLQHYEHHFAPLRRKRLNLLEIGVGGYGNANEGGYSLRMWKAYFPHANIFGIDIYDKKRFEEKRIKIFQGSQIDEHFVRKTVEEIGGVDIVIDDGSHINEHVIRTFQILFPLLRNPGIYVVEDTQTSYWPGFGGSSDELGSPGTVMGYFTALPHCINYEEVLRSGYRPTELDQTVVSVQFYHNLIFIYKGLNNEGSTRLRHNRSDDKQVFEGISYATSNS